MSLVRRLKDCFWSNALCRESFIYFNERRHFLREARTRFSQENPGKGSFRDYKSALRKHRVTYSEYMYSYEYWHLGEDERNRFIST